MATLSVIRRWALREQMSIREIARRSGLSRNTIKKYLRAGDQEPHYARRVSPSRLNPFAEKLAGWLKSEVNLLTCVSCSSLFRPPHRSFATRSGDSIVIHRLEDEPIGSNNVSCLHWLSDQGRSHERQGSTSHDMPDARCRIAAAR